MTRLPLKICGITRPQDARLVAATGAAYAGFVFAAKSPRFIAPERAAGLDTGPALRVGVFTGTPPDELRRVMALARLDFVQLHGGEDLETCRAVGRAVGPERVIKVLWPEALAPDLSDLPDSESRPESRLEALARECERFAPVCALFLLDAGQRGGGSGRSLDFALFRDFAPPRPWLLAGGLGPHNLAEAVAACSPHAFDCNSGLEEAPGRKDPGLVRAAATILARSRPPVPEQSSS